MWPGLEPLSLGPGHCCLERLDVVRTLVSFKKHRNVIGISFCFSQSQVQGCVAASGCPEQLTVVCLVLKQRCVFVVVWCGVFVLPDADSSCNRVMFGMLGTFQQVWC